MDVIQESYEPKHIAKKEIEPPMSGGVYETYERPEAPVSEDAPMTDSYLKARIKELLSENNRLRNEKTKLYKDCKDKDSIIANQQQDMNSLLKDINDLHKERDELIRKIGELTLQASRQSA